MSKQYGKLDLRNMDCMELMKEYPDNHFELAIVDPPYFDGPQKAGYYKGTKQRTDVGDYKDLSGSWDIPDITYFSELFRISKNQIIWGCNYYDYILKGGRVVWVKGTQGSPFSMAEVAYQSFYNRVDLFEYTWSGFWQEAGQVREKRIHPTQKPVALYKWLLQNYVKREEWTTKTTEGCEALIRGEKYKPFKVLDTHLGSGSIAIACYYMGFDLVGSELDKDYYKAMMERIDKETSQQELF